MPVVTFPVVAKRPEKGNPNTTAFSPARVGRPILKAAVISIRRSSLKSAKSSFWSAAITCATPVCPSLLLTEIVVQSSTTCAFVSRCPAWVTKKPDPLDLVCGILPCGTDGVIEGGSELTEGRPAATFEFADCTIARRISSIRRYIETLPFCLI